MWVAADASGVGFQGETSTLEQVYYEYIITRGRKLIELGPFATWPLEEKAALDQILIEGGYIDIHDGNAIYHDMPNADDISREDAIRLAEEALASRYEVAVGHTPDWTVECAFLRTVTTCMWDIQFKQKAQVIDFSNDVYWMTIYVANVDSPSGQAHVYQSAKESDGPVIVAWDNRPEDERPRPGDLSEEEVVRIAKNAVIGEWLEMRGLPEDIFASFRVTTGISPNYTWADQPFGRVWVVQFKSDDDILHAYFNHIIVIINSETGEVLFIDNVSNG